MGRCLLCYGFYTGELISCKFESEAKRLPQYEGDLDTNGGHALGGHDPDKRRLTFEKLPILYPFGEDKDKEPYRVDSFFDHRITNYFTYMLYPLPKASGTFAINTILYAPPSLGCPFQYRIYSHIHYDETVIIGLRGLELLPDPGPNDPYIKARGHTTEHPDSVAYYGKFSTNLFLYKIAARYYELSGLSGNPIKLSINDMSLIHGGLFDITGKWTTVDGHGSHREGKDADINKAISKDGKTKIQCMEDFYMRIAVDSVLPTLPRSAAQFSKFPYSIFDSPLLCEGDPADPTKIDNIHIDFENLEWVDELHDIY